MKLELNALTVQELVDLQKEVSINLRTRTQVESMKAALNFKKGDKVKVNLEKKAGETFDVKNVGRTRAMLAGADGKDFLCYLSNLESIPTAAIAPEVKAPKAEVKK